MRRHGKIHTHTHDGSRAQIVAQRQVNPARWITSNYEYESNFLFTRNAACVRTQTRVLRRTYTNSRILDATSPSRRDARFVPPYGDVIHVVSGRIDR